jgi:hypothetical protein
MNSSMWPRTSNPSLWKKRIAASLRATGRTVSCATPRVRAAAMTAFASCRPLLPAMQRADHDRLQFRRPVAGNQPGQADDAPVDLGYPEVFRPHPVQMFVKLEARLIAADGRALINVPVPLRKLYPEGSTRLKISRLVRPYPRHRL